MQVWIIMAVALIMLCGGYTAVVMHDNRWGEMPDNSSLGVVLFLGSWLSVVVIKVTDRSWLKTHKSVDRKLPPHHLD